MLVLESLNPQGSSLRKQLSFDLSGTRKRDTARLYTPDYLLDKMASNRSVLDQTGL